MGIIRKLYSDRSPVTEVHQWDILKWPFSKINPERVIIQKYKNKPRINKVFYHRFHVWLSSYISLIKDLSIRYFQYLPVKCIIKKSQVMCCFREEKGFYFSFSWEINTENLQEQLINPVGGLCVVKFSIFCCTF